MQGHNEGCSKRLMSLRREMTSLQGGGPKCGEQQEQPRICSPFPMAEWPQDALLNAHQRREARRSLGPAERILGRVTDNKEKREK